MKKILIILTATLFITLTANGQNLFFFGENSYPCTEAITLQSNSETNNLNIFFAINGTKALFIVSIKSWDGVLFSGKLITYLDDGTVVTCNDTGKHDYVDNIASSVYYLTTEQLSKMKNSNVNTVRYTLECGKCIRSYEEGSYSASNKGNPTKTVITEFFNEFEVTDEYIGVETGAVNAGVYSEGAGTGTEGVSYNLAGRQARSLPKPDYDIQSEGIVVVEVRVDRNGNVTQATPGVKGSTTLEEYFLTVARDAAMAAKFDRKPDAPTIQEGTITYHFILR